MNVERLKSVYLFFIRCRPQYTENGFVAQKKKATGILFLHGRMCLHV